MLIDTIGGAGEKQRLSLVLAVTSTGDLKPPVVMLGGKEFNPKKSKKKPNR